MSYSLPIIGEGFFLNPVSGREQGCRIDCKKCDWNNTLSYKNCPTYRYMKPLIDNNIKGLADLLSNSASVDAVLKRIEKVKVSI